MDIQLTPEIAAYIAYAVAAAFAAMTLVIQMTPSRHSHQGAELVLYLLTTAAGALSAWGPPRWIVMQDPNVAARFLPILGILTFVYGGWLVLRRLRIIA